MHENFVLKLFDPSFPLAKIKVKKKKGSESRFYDSIIRNRWSFLAGWGNFLLYLQFVRQNLCTNE